MFKAATLSAPPAIQTLDALRIHLQAAVELEHSTIPPYLAALYSLRPGANPEAAENIRTVVVQEMLHMILAANILNAVGGAPSIDDPRFVPIYPATLPIGRKAPIVVNIRRFSPEAIATFLAIESPAHPPRPKAPPKALLRATPPGQLLEALRRGDIYGSIGDFYAAIDQGLQALEAQAKSRKKTIFTGDPARQVDDRYYYNAGGEVIAVRDLEGARRALAEIVDQGEGYGDTIDDGDDVVFHQPSERAHWYRFNEIAQEQRYGPGDKPGDSPSGPRMPVDYSAAAVYPMIDNPQPGAYADPDLVRLSDRFSATYTGLLRLLHLGMNGQPARLLEAVNLMFEARNQATDLMRNPIAGTAVNAGPCFRYVAAAPPAPAGPTP